MKPANWINHKQKAEGPPPSNTLSFFHWALKGSFPVLFVSGFVSVLTGFGRLLASLAASGAASAERAA